MLEVIITSDFSMLQMQSISYLVSCNHFLIKVLSDAASCSEEYQFPLKNGLYPSERFVKGFDFPGSNGPRIRRSNDAFTRNGSIHVRQ